MSKTLFITGGTRGIGEATLRLFAGKGYRIAFTYKERDDRAEELSSEFPDLLGRRIDLGDEDAESQLRSFAKEALVFFGEKSFDVAVINAGESLTGLFSEYSAEEIGNSIDVNLIGALISARAVLPEMLREKKGSVVMVSSIWGERGASMEAVYASAKAGIIGFGRSLAAELGPSGIRVNMVAPGVIETDMNSGYSEEELKELVVKTPMGRLGKPEEVAEGILFLAEEGASFITGQVLTIDGGFTV